MRKVCVCALATVLGVPAFTAAADEVQLRSGDRLTGDVVRLDGGKLSFKTAYGELMVPWADVAALRLDQPMLVTVSGAEPRLATLDGIAVADVTALAPPEPGLVVSGGANAGLLTTGSNTEIDSLHLDGEVVARRRDDRFTTAAVVNRAADAGRDTARNATASFNYDRFLTTRLFLNGNAIFTNDKFRGLDLRSALGAGVGYEVWKTARSSLSVGAGLGYVRENFAAVADDSYAAVREAARLAAFFAGRRIEAFHRHDGYFGVTGEDNLFVGMQNGVRLALVGGLVSTLQLDLDYDRSPAPGRKQTDRSLSLTFGYRF
jgi:putative salt-induced outer membrane protein YdiY